MTPYNLAYAFYLFVIRVACSSTLKMGKYSKFLPNYTASHKKKKTGLFIMIAVRTQSVTMIKLQVRESGGL
jgi:hypothetical protein